jgi:phospho-2-dehydro-3-deoxyheptonate aldolase
MRVYFEKPRTTLGWKGLLNDPHLDETFRINEGLKLTRLLVLDRLSLGANPRDAQFRGHLVGSLSPAPACRQCMRA